jgi:serine/threonine-protein kinase
MPAPPDRVQALFFAALEKEPAERSRFLDHACRGDDDLRRRVEALLHAGEAADPLLDRPAAWHLDLAASTPLEAGTPLTPAAAEGEAPTPTQAGRFRLLGEIARGGMGIVLRAHDPELNRALAVKVVLPQYRGDPAITRRFLGEAQLAGQLQHPGVVPVHDLGRLPDGRPFFAMKLIEGRTLAQLLRERPDPGHDRPRFLRYFEAVCQAIGYAHSRGVIHRDLKPANVMVGAFGEVQVMDWGLAKRLGERPPSGQPSSGSDGPGGSPLTTQAGTLMGTPAYTPPEQASGAVEQLDERSDVFGLGAILCEILTGQPPYVGQDELRVRCMAAWAELASAQARLRGCGADAELVGLALACLAPKPADRPRDARAVAEALTAHLDGAQARLRQAELAEAAARARAAEEAKRRRLTLALAAVVLLAVALGGGTARWLQADRQARQAQLAREVHNALDQVTALREQARAATTDGPTLLARAREQAQRARALVQAGPADEVLVAQVERVQGELDEEEKDRQFLAAIDNARLGQVETVAPWAPGGPGASRFATERSLPLFREAFRAYGLAAGEGEPAAVAARLRRRPPQVREAVSAALDDWIVQATHPLHQVHEPHLGWLRALAAATADEGGTGEIRAAFQEQDPGKRRAALEKLAATADVRQLPPHTLANLAQHLLAAESPGSAIPLLRRAQQQYPADFWVNLMLGLHLNLTEPQRWAEAARYLTAAVALRPSSPGVHVNLGIVLWTGKQFDGAIACFEQAIALEPNYVGAHVSLGNLLCDHRRDYDAAIASLRKAIALDPRCARAHYYQGVALRGKGQVDEAIACYRQALALDPRNAALHLNLGNLLRDNGQVDEAVACFRAVVALDPKFAAAHDILGNALKVQGKADEAIAWYRAAIAIDPKYASAYYNLGQTLHTKGQVDEAIACYRKALELDPKCVLAHTNLGQALATRGKVDEAITSYRRAIEVDPKLAVAHYNLGHALASQGRLDEAIACYRKVLELDPKCAPAQTNLGHMLAAKGQVDEAITSYRRAIELDPNLGVPHYNLGTALQGKGRLDEAIACHRKALELGAGPADAEAHCNLGLALLERGDFAEALASLQRGHELGNKRGGWRNPSAQWVRDCEQLIEREKHLLTILAGKSAPANVRERVEWARLCLRTRRYAAAVRLWGEAFGAEPTLADDLKAGHRYQAATAAALAAAGKGRDAGGLENSQQAGQRKQALAWLTADLAARAKQPAGERAAELRRWQADEALAGVRGELAQRALPEAERAAWGEFWSQVQKHLRDEGGP